jgi:hypothetical protein
VAADGKHFALMDRVAHTRVRPTTFRDRNRDATLAEIFEQRDTSGLNSVMFTTTFFIPFTIATGMEIANTFCADLAFDIIPLSSSESPCPPYQRRDAAFFADLPG